MVPYIPEDIWTMILEQECLDTPKYVPFTRTIIFPPIVGQVSLINKEMRRLALPFLFHTLEFSTSSFLLGGTASTVRLIRQTARARSLLGHRSRHLLRHVQNFGVYGWSGERTATMDLPDLRELAEAVYGMISNLAVSALMPYLRDVSVGCSPMTPRLHSAIFSASRTLRSVEIWSWCSGDVREFCPEPQRLSILDLKYTMADSPATRANFAHIILAAMPTLRRLNIPSYLASALVTCVAANPDIGFSVEDLSVVIPDSDRESAMWDLFRISPELRSLHIYEAEDLEPSELGSASLPNLEIIDVRSYLVPSLTFGKKLQKLLIRDSFDGGVYSATDIIQSSPPHLREIELGISVESYQQFLSFLRSLCPFRNLECLRLSVIGRAPCAEHEKEISREQMCDTLVKELQHWKFLRTCLMHGSLWGNEDGSSYDPWHYISNIDNIPCPIAPECDPLSRGHESLETFSLQFLKVSQWQWIAGNGWTRGTRPIGHGPFWDD